MRSINNRKQLKIHGFPDIRHSETEYDLPPQARIFFFFLNKIVPCGLGFLYAVDVPKSLSVLILAEIQWILKNQLEESWS